MDPVSTTSTVKASVEFLKLMSGLPKAVRDRLSKAKSKKSLDTLYKRIGEIRQVKTIWQTDRAVDLADFYCHPHVLVEEKRKIAESVDDLGKAGNILLEGIAGQGKSIFLRYLCDRELGKGKYIPMFVELGRISETHSLLDRILAAFRALELPGDEMLFQELAASGRLLLMLDAFDEIPESLKPTVVTEIEDLAKIHRGLRLIVTSRPHETIAHSSQFSLAKLDNLRNNEYTEVIKKLSANEEWRDTLLAHVEDRTPHIKALLCTPLIVTLLVVAYKTTKTLPTSLPGFYKKLFPTLLSRHDGEKPGVTRDRRCGLTDDEYEEVFNAFCFFCAGRGDGDGPMSRKQIISLTKDALKETRHAAKPEEYIEDIIRTTCLILREGDEHRFIHRTVREYHTAAFVVSKPEAWARRLYEAFGGRPEHVWEQELAFLAEIDTDRYRRYCALPMILAAIGATDAEPSGEGPRNPEACQRTIASYITVIQASDGGGQWQVRHKGLTMLDQGLRVTFLVGDCLSVIPNTPKLIDRDRSTPFQSLADYLDKPECSDALREKLQLIVEYLWNCAKELKAEIARSDDTSLLGELGLLPSD